VGLLMVILLLGCSSTQSLEKNSIITIDALHEYQAIDGFGGTECFLFPPASEYSRLFDDLGVSILRFRMLRYIESTPDQPGNEPAENDNDDPNMINWNRVDKRPFDTMAPLLKSAQSRGVKLFGNISCPPPWMKTSNIADGPGSLKAGYEDELIEFILIWLKGMEKYHGVHIDYVNFQNEPNYQAPYPSCYVSSNQFVYLTKWLGARLKAEGITTKIIPPETSNLKNFISYAKTICGEPDSKANAHLLTTHSYNINFFKPDENNKKWESAYALASKCKKRLWLTEYCLDYNTKGTWEEAISIVQHVHNALVYGQVSAWLYHELYRDPSGSPLALIDKDRDPYQKFYTLKQYFRYVRPGAVRVKSESTNSDILATAFLHKKNDTITIVVINRLTFNQNVSFNLNNIKGLSNLKVIRTSSTENSSDLGQVPVLDNSLTYTLPSKSITSFIGTCNK
jgi:O-glycosyl hydrolase